MRPCIVYIYAGLYGAQYQDYALRFLDCYQRFPPGVEHDTVVVLNGLDETTELTCLFSALPNLKFLRHDNSGYDIGGFQKAAREVPADLMVFFGASTYFERPGWLRRMLQAYEKRGPALYGAMGNRGDAKVRVSPHIRTTAFWMEPGLLNRYPFLVTRPEHRHPFEHGPQCFTGWVNKQGLQAWVVTWDREYLWHDWDMAPNGFQRGNQSDLLAGDHICEPPYYPRQIRR